MSYKARLATVLVAALVVFIGVFVVGVPPLVAYLTWLMIVSVGVYVQNTDKR